MRAISAKLQGHVFIRTIIYKFLAKKIITEHTGYLPTLVAARSKAWVRDRSLAKNIIIIIIFIIYMRVRIPPGAWMSPVLNVLYFQVQVSATGCSLGHRIRTDCGVSECKLVTSIRRRPWRTRCCCATRRKGYLEL